MSNARGPLSGQVTCQKPKGDLKERELAPLASVYESTSTRELSQKYDLWAPSYDADLAVDYRACPELVANVIALLIGKNDSVLDVGCGTGMVGETLARLGHTQLTGVDISPGMLDGARKKGVYSALHTADLNIEPLPYPNGSMAAVAAAGVFTFNHLRVEVIDELIRVLQPGGYLVISLRDEYLAQAPTLIHRLFAAGMALIRAEEPLPFGCDQLRVMTYQKQ